MSLVTFIIIGHDICSKNDVTVFSEKLKAGSIKDRPLTLGKDVCFSIKSAFLVFKNK